MSLALLHFQAFNYHLCLGDPKCPFRFHLYPEPLSALLHIFRVRDSLHRSAHSHIFLEVSCAPGALCMELHGDPILTPWASLSHPHPPQLCLLGLPLISHVIPLLQSEHRLPKLLLFPAPTDIISCMFGQGLLFPGDHYRKGVRVDFLSTSQKRAQDPLSRERSARSLGKRR